MAPSSGPPAPARHTAHRARLAVGLGSLVVTAAIVVGMTATQRLAEGRSGPSAAGEAAGTMLLDRLQGAGSAVPTPDLPDPDTAPVSRSGAS